MTKSKPAMTGDRAPNGRVRQSPPVRWTGLVLGMSIFAVMMAISPRAGMSEDAWRVAGLAALMAVWWLSEALPVAVTALAPIAALPILEVVTLKDAASPYAHPLIFLFMGGFMIALAIERWGLHRRVALAILRLFGTRPASLVAGFMVASAGLSMWVSNTATAVMMLPIGLSVIALLHEDGVAVLPAREDHAFSLALLLAIAYGASIGGLGTLIGTPPNALLAAFMSKTYGFEIGFGQWMLVGVPLALIMLCIAWLVLTRIAFRVRRTPIAGAEAAIETAFKKLGPMSAEEKRVAAVFAIVALMWVFRPLIA